LVREGRAPDRGEVDLQDLVGRRPEVLRDPLRRVDLLLVALPIVDREGMDLATLLPGHREGRGRVKSPGEEDDGTNGRHAAANRWRGIKPAVHGSDLSPCATESRAVLPEEAVDPGLESGPPRDPLSD